MLPDRLTAAAREVGRLISELHLKLVLGESCTAGLAAAALGGVPGGSAWLCGSAVVYRTETKRAWLDVNPPEFDPPEKDSVGPQTSEALARALLRKTPEADLAATITGHLGPEAPPELDGRSFMRIVPSEQCCRDFVPLDMATAYRSVVPPQEDPVAQRSLRQEEAAAVLLEQLGEYLKQLKRYDDGTHAEKNPTP
jgi:nicotinamide-nucleotide amidase